MVKQRTAELNKAVEALKREITERKQVEKSLELSEKIYRTILDSSMDGIVILDDSANIVSISRGAEEIFDYSGKEVIGKPLKILIPEDRVDETTRILKEVKKKGFVRNFITKRKRKDGSLVDVDITVTNLGDLGCVNVVRDITEQKQAEEALRESEAKYRSLVESTNAIPWKLDLTSRRFTYMGKQVEQVFGYPADTWVDAGTWADRIYPKDRKAAVNYCNRAIKQGENHDFEYRMIAADGSIVWIRDIVSVKVGDQGPEELIGFMLNITERKKAEEEIRKLNEELEQKVDKRTQELRETREYTENIIKSMLDALLVVNPDTTIKTVNKAIINLLGYKENELIGKPISMIFAAAEEGLHLDAIGLKELIKKGFVREVEKTLLAKDGNKIPVLFSGSVMRDPEGKIQGIVCAALDITERKLAEDELKESREELRNLAAHLQSIQEEERRRIARDIHDDLGQMLTALKLGLSHHAKSLPKAQKSLIKESKKMSRLADDAINTLQRISSELRPALLDDLGLVAAIEWQVKEYQNRTGIKCELTFDPEEITLDEELSTAIFRALQASLTNIVRHADATRVNVSVKVGDNRLFLKVVDNGRGITEKEISDPKSIGLVGIRERFYPWRGKVQINGIQGKGTIVMVSVPLDKGRERT
jgi:PAS domain S-box-containing protein